MDGSKIANFAEEIFVNRPNFIDFAVFDFANGRYP